MKKYSVMGAVAACLMLAGCGAEGDVKKAFVAEYQKELCMPAAANYPVSLTVSSPFGVKPDAKIAEVLVKAGVLEKGEETSRGAGAMTITNASFGLTSKGKDSYKNGKLCYGETKVKEVVKYEEKDDGNGPYIMASVKLEHDITEGWAEHQDLRGLVKSGEEVVTRRLVKKDKEGWVIE